MEIHSPKVNSILKVFKHRNYRIYFLGMSISLVGSWISSVALSWLVYRLTDSGFMLGLATFASQFMMIILPPVSGVLLDRYDRKKLLCASQIGGMVLSFSLACLILFGKITVWQIILINILRGAVMAFDMPARHSLAVNLVSEKHDIPKAIAINSAMFNAARLVGPAIGGLIIAAWGEAACFIIDAISFIPSAISVMALRVPKVAKATQHTVLQDMKEGVKYAYNNRGIRVLLTALAFGSLMCASFMVLLPVFVRDVFHLGPRALGFLMAASGLGALIGALSLATRQSIEGLGDFSAKAYLFLSAGIIILAFSPTPWIAAIALFITGHAFVSFAASCNTMLQTLAHDEKRGRVMSLYTLALIGAMPIGSLLGGSLAGAFGGAETATGITGISLLVIALAFAQSLATTGKQIQSIPKV